MAWWDTLPDPALIAVAAAELEAELLLLPVVLEPELLVLGVAVGEATVAEVASDIDADPQISDVKKELYRELKTATFVLLIRVMPSAGNDETGRRSPLVVAVVALAALNLLLELGESIDVEDVVTLKCDGRSGRR